MSTREQLIEVVRTLVQAENEQKPGLAERFLSDRFAGITRASGVEQDRQGLLNAIQNPANPGIHRELRDDIWTSPDDSPYVVRSIVVTKDQAKPDDVPASFRNIHVFESDGGNPRCIAWQVTKFQGN